MTSSIKLAICLGLCGSALVVFSCTDNFDASTGLTGTDDDIMDYFQAEKDPQLFNIPSSTFYFKSEKGVEVTAEPDSFVFEDDGSSCTGLISFEFIELYSKSEIMLYGFGTRVLDFNNILESDGEFSFKASQNGRNLELAEDKNLLVTVPNDDVNTEMQLFRRVEDSWRELDSLLTNEIGYVAEIKELEWVNIDYFSKFDFDLTNVLIDLPNGYDQFNTLVFAVFEDLNIAYPISGNPIQAELPIESKISFVVIAAEDSGTFRFDMKEETVDVDLTVELMPERTSPTKIKAFLEMLD